VPRDGPCGRTGNGRLPGGRSPASPYGPAGRPLRRRRRRRRPSPPGPRPRPLTALEPRITAAIFGGGFVVHESLIEAARRVTGIGVRLRAGRRYRCRISSYIGPGMHAHRHERTSADDQRVIVNDPRLHPGTEQPFHLRKGEQWLALPSATTLASVPDCAGKCRIVRGFSVGDAALAPDLWGFCGDTVRRKPWPWAAPERMIMACGQSRSAAYRPTRLTRCPATPSWRGHHG
jgi:hypothetical protein